VERRGRRSMGLLTISKEYTVFRCLRKITKSDYQPHRVCPSVRPHGTTRLPLDGFSLNLISEYFSKMCLEKSKFRYNLTRITGTLREEVCTFVTVSR